MARLTKTEAIAQLTALAAVVAIDERGEGFELRPKSAMGTSLTAMTERLRLASASEAIVRVHDASGRPWVLTLRFESAAMRGTEMAEAVFRAVGLRLDPAHRKAQRVAINGRAWLTAVNCQNVVDRDVVEARIIDVADGGVAVVTTRLLRPGDRLLLRARFFATELNTEVRVARIHEEGGLVEAGCRLIGITAEQRELLNEVIAYREPSQAPSIRELLDQFDPSGEAPSEAPSLWRRLLRKAA
jgi:hypothetical protein